MAKEKLICNYDELPGGEYYDLNLVPKSDGDAVVVGGGHVHCGPKAWLERSSFKYHVIEFIVSGEGTLVLHGKKHPLYPGTLFYYSPRMPHKIWTDPDHLLVKHYVMFAGDELVERVKATKLAREPLHTPHPVRISNIFESLLETGREESRHRNELCVLLLRQLILSIDEAAILPKVSRSPAWQTYLHARELIEQN